MLGIMLFKLHYHYFSAFDNESRGNKGITCIQQCIIMEFITKKRGYAMQYTDLSQLHNVLTFHSQAGLQGFSPLGRPISIR